MAFSGQDLGGGPRQAARAMFQIEHDIVQPGQGQAFNDGRVPELHEGAQRGGALLEFSA
ncbi:hypothetical protein ACW9KT_19590 [Hymenobacter sp. HD11105]